MWELTPEGVNGQINLGMCRFLEEAWKLYNGDEPNTQRLTHLVDQQQQQGQGGFGAPGAAPGVGGGELIGGSAAREWQGQSSYF